MAKEARRRTDVTTDAGPAKIDNSDAALVRRALDGDGDAFASLFHLHKSRVYAVCLRMTKNTAEADDLTQDVFIQVFRKLSTFRGESALSTWLYRLAVNTALMHFRKQAPRQVSLDDNSDHDANPVPKREHGRRDDRLSSSLDRIALTRALESLPAGYRTIFELHEIKGYGHREIAKLLRCSVGNSKSQLHKAKQRIREFLLPRRERIVPMQSRSAGPALARKALSTNASYAGADPDTSFALEPTLPQEAETLLVLGSSTQCLAETAV
jgi:RNA polymerase sigma-70 factor, ECF subfamily